jgi:hypothetical protein
MFDIWMTAYPFANASEWRTRLYTRLTTTVVIGVLWVCWLYGCAEIGEASTK